MSFRFEIEGTDGKARVGGWSRLMACIAVQYALRWKPAR
jgi:hypothetical protein